jgi:hypothetical protein
LCQNLTVPFSGNEGVFLVSKGGTITQLMRAGEPAPGGDTFDVLELGIVHLNDEGDLSFAFTLSPLDLNPVGANSGVYRYSHVTKILAPVMIPYVTPAPSGGTFAGAFFDTSMNNHGDIVFSGLVPDSGPSPPDTNGLGMGVFKADKGGHITRVAGPGDRAPGGGTFDLAGGGEGGSINDGGDVAFTAHVQGQDCGGTFCPGGVYLKEAGTGQVLPIARQGDPEPGGGNFRSASEPFLNNLGEVVFLADVTPPPNFGEVVGYFLYSNGAITSVVRPGDAMPGGGRVLSLRIQTPNHYLNNHGDVAFSATLDTDDNGDRAPDSGLYVLSHGSIHVVARTGTVLPGVGTIANLAPPVASPSSFLANSSSGMMNDRGQVFFQATLEDGRGVLLLATPHSNR